MRDPEKPPGDQPATLSMPSQDVRSRPGAGGHWRRPARPGRGGRAGTLVQAADAGGERRWGLGDGANEGRGLWKSIGIYKDL